MSWFILAADIKKLFVRLSIHQLDASIKEGTVGNTFGLSIDCLDLIKTTKCSDWCIFLETRSLKCRSSLGRSRTKSLRMVLTFMNRLQIYVYFWKHKWFQKSWIWNGDNDEPAPRWLVWGKQTISSKVYFWKSFF